MSRRVSQFVAEHGRAAVYGGAAYLLVVLVVAVVIVARAHFAAARHEAVRPGPHFLARPMVAYVAVRSMEAGHEIAEEDLQEPDSLSRTLRVALPARETLVGRLTAVAREPGEPLWLDSLFDGAASSSDPPAEEPRPPEEPQLLVFSVSVRSALRRAPSGSRVWIAQRDSLVAEAELEELRCIDGELRCEARVRVDASLLDDMLQPGEPVPALVLTLPWVEAQR